MSINPAHVFLFFRCGVALCVASGLHAALGHNVVDCIEYLASAGLMGGTMAIARAFRPEMFEPTKR